MIPLSLVVLTTAMLAQSSSSPDAVDDFNRISTSLSQKTSSEIKITEEKLVKKMEIKSEGSQQSAFRSQFFHQGHNLFYQPQILIGSDIIHPFISSNVDHKEYKEQIITNIIDCKENELPIIPEMPTLSPLVMPDLPKPVIIKEPDVIPSDKQDEETTKVLLVIPEVPTLSPLVMPDLPKPVIIKEPVVSPVDQEREPELNSLVLPIEVTLPKPLPHIPTCLNDIYTYGITVPCPPTMAVLPEIIGIKKVMVEKTLVIPETKPILNLRLPKIPLGIVYNKPVKTLMPYPGGFISTTRFLPSIKVSKIPLERFSLQNVLFSRRPLSEILVEKIRKERVEFSSYSAYCAHNIALERVLPNIVVAKKLFV